MQRQSFKVVSLGDRHSLVKLSDRVCLIVQSLKRAGKGGRKARLVSGYIGCTSQRQAVALVRGLKAYLPKCFAEIRQSQRVSGYPVEIKIRYSFDGLETLLWSFAADESIISTGEMSADEAKRSIFPAQPQLVNPIELAPLQIRSGRPQKIGRYAIE